MPRVQNHTHKLKRFKYKSTGTAIFFCTLPDCTFKSDTHLTLGKRSICWRCNQEFLINEYAIRLSRPHCMGCKKTKGETITEDKILKDISADTVSNLKDRLSKITSPFSKEEVEA